MTILSDKILCRADYISQNLAFRHSADDLFSCIDTLEEPTIIVDFSKTKSITRSFAHQYMANKTKTRKHIIERDMPYNIKQMFDLVERQKSKTKEIHREPIEVLNVVCGF